MMLKLATIVLLACAACHSNETKPPQRINVEVTGSPECLGRATGRLGLPAVTMPVWSNDHGTMEFGPFEATKFSEVVKRLQATKCVQAIRQRPCANGLSDVDMCDAPERRN